MSSASLQVVIQAVDEASAVMRQVGQETQDMAKQVQDAMRIVGGAMTAVGGAGLKTVSDARQLNAVFGQTALTIDAPIEELRALALETTNVTFPLESVAATFDLLARAGVEDMSQLQASAGAFDALADATGSTAEKLAEMLIPAYKNLGQALPTSAKELDKFAWLTKNTMVDLDDFAGAMNYVATEGGGLGVTVDEMVAMMAALEKKGITGSAATRVFRSAVTEAANSGASLTEALGLTDESVASFQEIMNGAVGITDQYAAAASEQFGIMDRVKQATSELSLQMGSLLEPMEPILGAMASLGPILMALSMTNIPRLIASVGSLGSAFIGFMAPPGGLIILAIAGLIAAGVAIWKNWDTISEKAVEIWTGIKDFFGDVWDRITGLFEGGMGDILRLVMLPVTWPAELVKHWDAIKDAMLKPILAARDAIAGVMDRIKELLAPLSGGESAGGVVGIGGLGEIQKLQGAYSNLPGYAAGGMITEPTLLYGLRSQRPYAIAGEAGPEAVISQGMGGGFTFSPYIAELHVREEADVPRIARELRRLMVLEGAT